MEDEFETESAPRLRWLDDGGHYTTLENSESYPERKDLVRHGAADGRSQVLVPAERLIPASHDEPLEIDDYHWSDDGSKLLIFTNSQRVWRRNTRGDYWVLDMTSSDLAYEQGSPITFADHLEGNLLIIHGTGDDNVHYQGAEALIDKLIAEGKKFSMMAYPNRSHGISEGEGTRRHLYGLMTDYLHRHAPPNDSSKR